MKKAANNFKELFDSVYLESNQKEYLLFHKVRFKILYQFICKLKPKKILDIGKSDFTKILNKADYNPLLIDKKDSDLEEKSLPFQDNSFDLVIFTEVIEHLHKNYLGSLKEISRIIKPNKFILFSTPNAKSLRKVLRIGKRDKGHFREFSMQECLFMLQRAGFKIISNKEILNPHLSNSIANIIFLFLSSSGMSSRVLIING